MIYDVLLHNSMPEDSDQVLTGLNARQMQVQYCTIITNPLHRPVNSSSRANNLECRFTSSNIPLMPSTSGSSFMSLPSSVQAQLEAVGSVASVGTH